MTYATMTPNMICMSSFVVFLWPKLFSKLGRGRDGQQDRSFSADGEQRAGKPGTGAVDALLLDVIQTHGVEQPGTVRLSSAS